MSYFRMLTNPAWKEAPMKKSKPYPFPLPESALRDFCHPRKSDILSKPWRDGRNLFAANGHIALRASRGAWIDDEFDDIPQDVNERLQALPWSRLEDRLHDKNWKLLDNVANMLFRYPQRPLFYQSNGKTLVNPCPTWMLGNTLVKLSVIQMVARLPRAEAFIKHGQRNGPIYIRYSGGVGIIAGNPNLKEHSIQLYAPKYDPLGGYEI
jgi:hypothetical protein